MSSQHLKISETQNLALSLLNNPQIVSLLFGGGAGGAKSFLVCLWMVLECRNYPGIHIGLGRQELKRLKQTTVVTLLSKVHPALGVKSHEFNYNDQKGVIDYINGSQIQLVDLAYHPSDPDFDTFGSLELSHIVVEEVGEVTEKAVDVLGSRKNRFLNKEHGIVGKLVMTCNPTQNFIRQQYYEPYKTLGMGRMQKWEDGTVELPDGTLAPSYRAFIRSLVTDNPFAPRNYIEDLKKLPASLRKRLYEGDWDYTDDDTMLFTSLTIDRATTSEVSRGKKAIGIDLADTGKDKTRLVLVEDGVAVDHRVIKVDAAGEKVISEQTALEIIKYAQQHGFAPKDARDIGIDGVGIGVGVRDFLRSKGWFVQVFIAGSSGEEGYKNLRSQEYWNTSQDMQNGSLKMYSQLPDLTEMRRDLMAHEFTTEERVIKVLPKDKVKEKLGRSPDSADSLVIARWVYNGKTDSRYNTKRVVF